MPSVSRGGTPPPGLFALGHGFSLPTNSPLNRGQPKASVLVIRLEAHGLFELSDRRVQPSCLREGDAEVVGW